MSRAIAKVVLEYFLEAKYASGTTNDILRYYVETYGESNDIELKRARHAIYLKANRLVKSGKLCVRDKEGRQPVFAMTQVENEAGEPVAKTGASSEKAVLTKRIDELTYELELSIAEAQGYEDMKLLLPNHLALLKKKKEETKKRTIQINGHLTSTQIILNALSV